MPLLTALHLSGRAAKGVNGHDAMHFDQYWWAERCPDAETRQRIVDVCPHNGIVIDKHNPEELHLHFEECNQCGRCLQVAPPGSLKID